MLQTLLLLRDSDLRRLQPHYVSTVTLPGCGPVPVLGIYQQKTDDDLRLPLSPQAAAIWERLDSRLFVPVQQYRNRHMKQFMELAGLSRTFMQVTYVANKPVEQVLPLWQVVTTHTARHTGADLIMLGSGGNSDLKEKALGHAAVYGHDSLERYGTAVKWAGRQLTPVGSFRRWQSQVTSSTTRQRPSRSGRDRSWRKVSFMPAR